MPLTNTQYDQIMRGYQDRQLKRQQLIDTRREEIAAKIPKITELDAQIASLSVRRARQLLDGDASALTDLHDQSRPFLPANRNVCKMPVIRQIIFSHPIPARTVRTPAISARNAATV